MEILDELNDSLEVCNPTQTTHAARPMDGFVDDTMAWANQFVKELTVYAYQESDTETAYAMLHDLVEQTTKLAQS